MPLESGQPAPGRPVPPSVRGRRRWSCGASGGRGRPGPWRRARPPRERRPASRSRRRTRTRTAAAPATAGARRTHPPVAGRSRRGRAAQRTGGSGCRGSLGSLGPVGSGCGTGTSGSIGGPPGVGSTGGAVMVVGIATTSTHALPGSGADTRAWRNSRPFWTRPILGHSVDLATVVVWREGDETTTGDRSSDDPPEVTRDPLPPQAPRSSR
jgi:hypothetical protein